MGITIDENAYRGGDGGGYVVAQSVVADAFIASAGRQNINSHSTIGHRRGPKGRSMERSDDGKPQQGSGDNIAAETYEVGKEAYEEHTLARKAIDYEPAERSYEEGSDGIAREHHSNHVLGSAVCLAQIKRQQGCEQIEGKRQREVGYHHLPVVAVPKTFGSGLHLCATRTLRARWLPRGQASSWF